MKDMFPRFRVRCTDRGYILKLDSDGSGEWSTETYRCMEDMFDRMRGITGIYYQSCYEDDLPMEQRCLECRRLTAG